MLDDQQQATRPDVRARQPGDEAAPDKRDILDLKQDHGKPDDASRKQGDGSRARSKRAMRARTTRTARA